MRQAVITAPGQIEFNDVTGPSVSKDQVQIRIQQIGICGSDIHVFHGKHPFVTYPLVQGHEFTGIVEAIGDGVKNIAIGDKVTATPQEVCGKCSPCRRGQYNACEVLKVRGFQALGCAGELFTTESEKIIKLPEHFSLDQGAFVEPVAVAVHATGRIENLEGKNIVVAGAGTIGNLIAQACKCRGAQKVLITDISEFRLNKAKQVGIESTCNVSKESLEDATIKKFGSDGFDIGLEVSGTEASLTTLVANIGKGGTLLIIGVYGDKPTVDMSVVCEHELTVKGSMMYRHKDWQQAVKWIDSGQIVVEPLVSKHFPFESYLDAYKFIEQEGERSMKVMIDIENK